MRLPAHPVITMLVVEALAFLGFVGAIIAYAFHEPFMGVIGLVAALVANGVLVIWARKLSPGARDQEQQRPVGSSTREELNQR